MSTEQQCSCITSVADIRGAKGDIYIYNWKIDENIDSYITELHTLTKTANYCFSQGFVVG